MKDISAVHEYHLEIKDKDIDILGHVNNATYLVLLEEARWDMIQPHGWGKEDIIRKQISPIVLDVQMQFKRELKKGENVLVKTWCHDPKGKVCKVSQEMIKEDGKAACVALFTMALMDLKARKLVDPPAEWIKAVGLD